jgi:uncharacterized protein YdhG (YjbR/CyaY superfamily)
MTETPEVDAYLEGLEPERRAALETLRALVFRVAPELVETMRYRMPTYEHKGEMVCAFASQKHYISLYMDVEIVEQHKAELVGLNIGKSCIRFRRIEQLPIETIETMLRQSVQKRRS